MNSVLYNYKYMYRRCRNLWTWDMQRNESIMILHQEDGLQDLDVSTVSPPQTPPLSWTVRLMHYASLQDSATLVCSFLFFFILFSGEMRDILGKFILAGVLLWREMPHGWKSNCLSPSLSVFLSLSSLTGLMAANGQKANFVGRAHTLKGERQFPEKCTTEL